MFIYLALELLKEDSLDHKVLPPKYIFKTKKVRTRAQSLASPGYAFHELVVICY